ncbi:MAG: sigma-70 family RNA polymerase sigma factor [Pseudomonadota bacterium]
MSDTEPAITQLLLQAGSGDESARDQLMEVVHRELKRLARGYMRSERQEHTLQATALVNEAYLELFGAAERSWSDRNHFFAYASQVMRHVLVHHARSRKTQKRGGDLLRVTLDGLAGDQKADELLALDEALERLALIDERKSRMVEMRFFGGLTIDEIADVTGLSVATIHNDLKSARGWLYHELSEDQP